MKLILQNKMNTKKLILKTKKLQWNHSKILDTQCKKIQAETPQINIATTITFPTIHCYNNVHDAKDDAQKHIWKTTQKIMKKTQYRSKTSEYQKKVKLHFDEFIDYKHWYFLNLKIM